MVNEKRQVCQLRTKNHHAWICHPGSSGDDGVHVYVAEDWTSACGEADELESGILEFAFGVDDRSRLSCQIVMSDELEGLTLHLPKRQY